MKKFLLFVVMMICAFAFTAVYADDLADVQAAGVLNFGTSPYYIPFAYYDESGEMTGIDVALMQEVARRMGVSLKKTDIAFDGLIDSLEIGQVDVIGGALTKNDERAERIDFTRIYYNGSALFVSKAGKTASASGYEAFRNTKLGVEKGTSFEQWIRTNLVNGGIVSTRNVYTYSKVSDAMSALDRGDVDAVLMDQDIYEDLYAKSGKYTAYYSDVTKENYAFGCRKNSTLTTVINGHLTDMIKDGTAQTIANRFFQTDYSSVVTSVARPSQIATPTASASASVIIPTAAPSTCVNSMSFVKDVTITDGHQVKPGERFTKTWRIYNNGTCTWTPAYSFVYVSGDQMSGRNINIPTNVAPGQTIDISVDMIAPNGNGTYRGYWQMRGSNNVNFGATIWCKIRVQGSAPAPTATPRPQDGQKAVYPSVEYFYPDAYSGVTGGCPTVYWGTKNANTVIVTVDGVTANTSYNAYSQAVICSSAFNTPGTHTIQLIARNVVDDTYSSFGYTVYADSKEDGQKDIRPSIDYFYPDYYTGIAGGCPTVYWGTSNADMIYITVDGATATTSSNASGAAVVCSSKLDSAGSHTIELLARNVVDDTYSSFGYTTYTVNPDPVYVNDPVTYSDDSTVYYDDSDTYYDDDTNFVDDCLVYDDETDTWYSICE